MARQSLQEKGHRAGASCADDVILTANKLLSWPICLEASGHGAGARQHVQRALGRNHLSTESPAGPG
eukprot:6748181-Pyramimonas_sp.AAC.1